MMRWPVLLLLLLGVCSAPGCGRTRVVTISTDPPDALIRVGNRDRGRGPLTETFTFSGDVVAHAVGARRAGYNEQVVTITPESPETLPIRLKPIARRITVRVDPPDAVVRLDGKVLRPDAAGEVRANVDFPLDPAGRWRPRELRAEHPNFERQTRRLTYEEAQTDFTFDLRGMRKDIEIATVPEGAEVTINGEFFGKSTVRVPAVSFPLDAATGEPVKLPVRVVMAGYKTLEETISWEDGRREYVWTLEPQSKVVRIITEPADARVTFDGRDVPLDATGAHSVTQTFALDADGRPPTYEVVVSKKADDREWQEQRVPVSWDGGQTDYPVTLDEALTRPVPTLAVRAVRGPKGWAVTGEQSTPLATRDTGEGPGRPVPTRVTRLPEPAMIDGIAVAPDGSQVLFATLTLSDDGELRSRILAQPTDGSAEVTALTDGRSLAITPAFTPDGSRVVFASDRVGPKLSIWSMPAAGAAGEPRQITAGRDASDLWPSVDSSPKPRLFYQSLLDARPDERLFARPLDGGGGAGGGGAPLDLARAGGTQPRVGPKADAVVFAAPAGPGGKRDLFRVPDGGGQPVNLTNTPDVDEFDPAWSHDGRRVAYASDAGRTTGAPDNRDVFVLDVTRAGAEPVPVTRNGSWDDSPAWDVRGRAIYFRSNRGGEWNVWRIGLK